MVGERLAERDERGAPIMDDDLLVLLIAHHDAVHFTLPEWPWDVLLDTARAIPNRPPKPIRWQRARWPRSPGGAAKRA